MKRVLVTCKQSGVASNPAATAGAAKRAKSTGGGSTSAAAGAQTTPAVNETGGVSQQAQLPTTLKQNAVTDLGDGARVRYHPRHLASLSKRLLPILLSDVRWEQRSVNIFGRSVPQPRLICYMADAGLQYTYSGLSLQPQPWLPAVQEVKEAVEQLAGCTFNSCLLNYYRSGEDHLSWHADDEPLYGKEPTIASVSCGHGRDFVLRHTVHR